MKDGPTVEGCSAVVKRLRRLSGQNESGKELRTAVLAPCRRRLVKEITEAGVDTRPAPPHNRGGDMNSTDLVGLVGAFGLGSVLTAFGAAWLNHFLSERRSDREQRSSEVTFWRDYSDRSSKVYLDIAQVTRLKSASQLPADPDALVRDQVETVKRIEDELANLRSDTRRAPEPLTKHVRLFMDRLSHAFETEPPDQEYANFALVRFRQALDEYVRRGKTSKPKLRPNESWPDPPY